MRKLILKMSITVDGFVGGPNGEIDWIFKPMSEDATAWTVDKIWQAGAHLMGRKTFNDWLLTHPVATGQGLGLFAKLKRPMHLKLVETKVFSAGAVAHIYRPE